MKGKLALIAIIFIGLFWLFISKSYISESDAISILKRAYPEFQNYPNNNLPPQRIIAETTSDGYHIAFVQLGSGRPILGAKCFLVGKNGQFEMTGEYEPGMDDTSLEISPRTCG